MSYHFRAYRFPRRDLWLVVDALRAHLAANHRYAVLAHQLSLMQYRRIVRDGDDHLNLCATHYLGRCTCDFWFWRDWLRDYITDKQRDQNGLEGQLVEYGRDYVMRVCGEHHWVDLFPDALMEHLGMRELLYFDGSDVPPEDMPNKQIADLFDKAVRKHHYFMVPLLTVDDVDRTLWHMAGYLGHWAWQRRREAEPAR